MFNSGLVPWYLICRVLHLYNNIWALIIPSLIFTPFNMFLTRNFIKGVPSSLMDSARIDGAGELTIAFRIYFPICSPVIATITLFYALGYWNNWFNAIMLLDSSELYPLQMILFKIQSDLSMLKDLTNVGLSNTVPTESFKMASAIGHDRTYRAPVSFPAALLYRRPDYWGGKGLNKVGLPAAGTQ